MSNIKSWWKSQSAVGRFGMRNLLWGLAFLILGYVGTNSIVLIVVGAIMITIPQILIEFFDALKDDRAWEES